MSRTLFRGDAPARTDIYTVTVNAVIPGARYGVRCWNHVLASITAERDETLAALLGRFQQSLVREAGIDAALNSAGTGITLTGQEGILLGPHVDSTPGSYVETRTLGAVALAKTIRITLPEGTTGGTWGGVFDFGSGNETLSGVSATATAATLKTALAALATPTSSDLEVLLDGLDPRSWLVTFQGALAGIDVEVVSLDGSGLTGTAEMEISTVQDAAGTAVEVQALWFEGYSVASGELQVQFSRGGVTSAWVSGMNSYNTSGAIAAPLLAAIDSVVGAGQVTVTVRYADTGGGIFLVWNVPGDQDQVTIAARYNVGYSGAWYSYAASSETIRQSGANQNEILVIQVTSGGLGDDFDATFGATTAAISIGLTESATDTDWDAVTGGSTVHMGASSRDLYLLEFNGANANTNVGAVTVTAGSGSAASPVVLIAGQALQNEIHQIVVRADSGTFTLSSDGVTYTSALTYGLSAGTLQTALRGLTAIGAGNCNVTGTGTLADPYLVEYVSGKAQTDMPLLLATIGSLVGGFDPSGSTITAAVPGVQQIDQIYIDPNATGGTLLPAIDGVPGNLVAWDGNAAAWTTGLEAVDGVGVTVEGADSSFLVTYDTVGPVQLLLDQTYLTVSESSLLSLSQEQEASGPDFYNEALNWTGGAVPGSGDTPVFLDGVRHCQQGLVQRCLFTADVDTGDFVLGTNKDDSAGFVVGQAVYLSTTGTLPTAAVSGSPVTLSVGTLYYIRGIDRFRRRCQISTSASGSVIELTGAGSGVHQIGVRWAKIEQMRAHTGRIGLAQRLGGTWEERPRFLMGETASIEIGLGTTGDGTQLGLFDFGTRVFAGEQWYSGQGENEPAIQLRANNSSSAYRLRGGQLGLGVDGTAVVLGALSGQQSQVTLGTVSLASLDLSACQFTSLGGATVSGTIRNI